MPQFNFPRNSPTPTEKIAIVAIPLAIPPFKFSTKRHNVAPTTSSLLVVLAKAESEAAIIIHAAANSGNRRHTKSAFSSI